MGLDVAIRLGAFATENPNDPVQSDDNMTPAIAPPQTPNNLDPAIANNNNDWLGVVKK